MFWAKDLLGSIVRWVNSHTDGPYQLYWFNRCSLRRRWLYAGTLVSLEMTWIPAFAGMTKTGACLLWWRLSGHFSGTTCLGLVQRRLGITASPEWMPASAGMTDEWGIPAFAGMTNTGEPAYSGASGIDVSKEWRALGQVQRCLGIIASPRWIPAYAGMTGKGGDAGLRRHDG